jgi:hypothetical protein
VRPEVRGALAGAAAALAWRAADPVFKRIFGTPYADSELFDPLLGPIAGTALHVGNGAVFGYAFARLGGRGAGQGTAAAVAENALLWPSQTVVERLHPYCRDGRWPELARNPRVFAQATASHAFFGVLLGALGPK